MALINNLYVFLENEQINETVTTTARPVEKGLSAEETMTKAPLEMSISGKIVNVEGKSASNIIEAIKTLQRKGSLIKYIGRNISSANLMITSFNTDHPHTVSGGADFDMTLKQVRIAKSSYTPQKKVTEKTTNFKVGDVVVFKGGYVYVSSDAKKPAAQRGRSTCEITIINKRNWSKHDYHLISKDSGKVYGWVDFENIEPKTDTKTQGETNGGEQRVWQYEWVGFQYYTVKEGDTVESIMEALYGSPMVGGRQALIEDNPHAFTDPNDIRTLKVGARLLIRGLYQEAESPYWKKHPIDLTPSWDKINKLINGESDSEEQEEQGDSSYYY